MQNKNNVLSISMIGIITMIFSVVAFILLDIGRDTFNAWAVMFLLLSEIALFGGMVGLQLINKTHSKTFLCSGVTTGLVLYFVITLISMPAAEVFKKNHKIFILVQLTIILIFAIVLISIFACSQAIESCNKEDVKKNSNPSPKRGGF